MTGRPPNPARQIAIELGFPTYDGSPHARCGTTLRYTGYGACVRCSKAIAAEKREAVKLRKAQQRGEALTITIDDISEANVRAAFALDSEPAPAVETDDAEARIQASIDELM